MSSPQSLSPQNTNQVIPGTLLVQDTHYSVQYVKAVNSIQGIDPTSTTGSRYWSSETRRMDSEVWDVLLVNFRNPVSISRISFDLLQFPQYWEFWYYNKTLPSPTEIGQPFADTRSRLPVLDRSLRHLAGTIDTDSPDRWYSYDYQINSIVVRSLELRVRRKNDGTFLPERMISVGVRNFLCKREIYNEQDAMLPLEDGVDPMGNLVESFVRRWEPQQANDGEDFTFWKSGPQPSPDAVVNYYVDVRDSSGNAQRIDRIYLDPTHTGQSLNLYYSSDDTVGPRTLNLSRVTPVEDNNVNWIKGIGLDLSSTTALYSISTQGFNLDTSKSIWIAGTWIPGFNSGNPPAVNLSILSDDFNKVRIVYKPGLQSFEITWGTWVGTYYCEKFFLDYKLHFSLKIIQPGNTANLPPGIYFFVADDDGMIISSTPLYPARGIYPSEQTYPTIYAASTIPQQIVIPSTISLKYSQGFVSDLFIKQDAVTDDEAIAALLDLRSYLFPQVPVVDTQGKFQDTSLSNMVYAADFELDELGFGGLDDLYFTEKSWAPIWSDWIANKGLYYFPNIVYAKFIKLEFTNLTQEPYTIHESGITVAYQTFPIEVLEINQNILKVVSTFVDNRTTQASSTRGILYDNYYSNISRTTTSKNTAPVYFVNIGKATIDTVPRLYDTPIESSLIGESYYDETSASYATTSARSLASDAYYTVVSGDWLIKIGKTYNIPWQNIYDINRPTVDADPRVKLLPQRSPGWWIFPGQQLRIPNAIMEQITTTSTTTEKSFSSTNILTRRNRFVKTQVHRYQYRTASRDAAIAYFAGIKEIEVYRIDYTKAEDTEKYDFPLYDTIAFSMKNMVHFDYSGSWGSTESLTPLVLAYPDPTYFPSVERWPQGSASYTPSTANWSSTTYKWGATNASWGYVPQPVTGVIESTIWNSLSKVQAISINVYDRGLHQPITGKELAPMGLADSPVGYWSAEAMYWGDSIVVWGTRMALVDEEFRSNIQFGGQAAYSIYRVAGYGAAGILCTEFPIRAHTRIRIALDYYRPKDTGNDIILQILDVAGGLGQTVIFEQTLHEFNIGKWSSYHTNFHAMSDYDIDAAVVRLLISGTKAEQLYVGRMYPVVTTIVYEYSNDGGDHYYEASEVAYSTSTVHGLVFPTADNELRARVTMYDPNNDYVFGQTIVPKYV